MVNLVADHEITEAAQAIDAEVWPVHLQIRNGMTADGDWYALRDKVEARRRDFVNIARKRLSSAGPPLRRRTGRPADADLDDCRWRLVRIAGQGRGSAPGLCKYRTEAALLGRATTAAPHRTACSRRSDMALLARSASGSRQCQLRRRGCRGQAGAVAPPDLRLVRSLVLG